MLPCPNCGADLYTRAQEVCMTATSQGFTTQPDCPADTICTAYEAIEAHPDCQEDCRIECRDCGAALDETSETADALREAMSH